MNNKKKVASSTYWNRVSRVLIWIPGFLAVFLLLSFSAFQVPKVQSKVVKTITKFISDQTSFEISIDHANLTWYDQMNLNKIRIYDKTNDSTLIRIDQLSLDINIIHYILSKEIKGDILRLKKPELHVIKHNDSTEINLSKFIGELKNAFKKDKSNKKTTLNIEKVLVYEGTFSYKDLTKPLLSDRKDLSHFSYKNMNGSMNEFIFAGDSVLVQIDSLSAEDKSFSFDIHQLATSLKFSKTSLVLSELDLNIGKSQIRDSIAFFYNSPGDFKYLYDSIKIVSTLDRTKIHTSDIKLFRPNFKEKKQIISLSGLYKGRIRDLEVIDGTLRIGKQSVFNGSGLLVGLPNIEETFFDVKFDESQFSPNDFSNYLSTPVNTRLQSIGQVSFRGTYTGYLNDFMTRGRFITPIGYVNASLSMKIKENYKAFYEGQIRLNDFELSKFLNQKDEVIKRVSLNGKIKGSGLQAENAVFDITADIELLETNGYPYSNITTQSHFEKNLFTGHVNIKDPNIKLNGDINIDLREDKNKFKINAELNNANLQALKITHEPFILSSIIDTNIVGSNIQDTRGFLRLNKLTFSHQDRTLNIDSVNLISTLINDKRLIEVETEQINARLEGNYTNQELIRAAKDLYRDIRIQLANDHSDKTQYYALKSRQPIEVVSASLNIHLRDINTYISPFFPELKLSKNINIKGKLTQDSIISARLHCLFDSSSFKKNTFLKNEIDINLTKKYYGEHILGSAYLSSGHQITGNNLKTKSLEQEIIWNDDQINYYGAIHSEESDNRIRVASLVHFKEDTTIIQFLPSDISLLGNKWRWHKDHHICRVKDQIIFDKFGILSNEQNISLNGTYAEGETLNLTLSGVNLSLLNSISTIAIGGILDGDFDIQKNAEHHLIDGKFISKNITLDGFEVGNLFSSSSWQADDKRMEIKSYLTRNGYEKMDIYGYYYPFSEDQLNFQASFHDSHLKTFEPFLKQFSDLDGTLKGTFDITGSPSEPNIVGTGLVENGQARVNYLNTVYDFTGEIEFTKNSISTRNLKLIDREKNEGFLSGSIYHTYFKKYRLDLTGNFENFQILNTTSTDNSLYYGTAYGTGSIQFSGPTEDLYVKAQAKTTKGTRLSVPLSSISDENDTQKEYIEFMNLTEDESENSNKEDAEDKKIISGITFDLNVELTNDAYMELIFDAKSGDIIRGRGTGNMKLQADTQGEFNMFGDYNFEEGGYNFTLYNIINKEFIIKKGSTISWYGDPYGAQLSIDARYRQIASVAPLLNLSNEDLNSPEARRKYPSYVDLSLSGELLSPTIQFDINIEEYPRSIKLQNRLYPLESYISAFRTKIENNEQEMNRQVFSLIILRKFSPENSLELNSAALGNSISEFISNQLSYWANQVDENLEIDVDLASLDEDAFNTFQLRLSYTFLDGRLRVTRGGGLSSNDQTNSTSNIIGDWTVEYMLTADGRFRVKMYSRTDLNASETQSGENNFERGISLQFVRSFDKLKQLLRDSREEAIEQNL